MPTQHYGYLVDAGRYRAARPEARHGTAADDLKGPRSHTEETESVSTKCGIAA
jgi:hypothetical protein